MQKEKLNLRELVHNDWKNILKSEFDQEYFGHLANNVTQAYATEVVYPPVSSLFAALNRTSFAETNVIILGQDPYHGDGQAQGLSFSVPSGFPKPPSLVNICKEIFQDIGVMRSDGDLGDWADQGVLLLNTVLSVRAQEAGSHAKIGWQIFTKAIITHLNAKNTPLVFMLWGNYAQRFASEIDETKHFVIRTAHPSPLSANRGGWFGTKPFSRANDFLVSKGLAPIQWA